MIWDKKIKKRIIGLYGDMMSDKLIIALAGVHGNEKAGVIAIENVMHYLQENQIKTKGCMLGLKGNIAALEENKRYIDIDLNRLWYEEQMNKVRNTEDTQLSISEEKEQKELLFLLEQFVSHRATSDPFLFIDFHTTSANNGLFTIVNENILALQLANQLQVPVIKGLTEVLSHTTLEMYSKKQYAALAFEAGQHDDIQSILRMEAYMLLSLHNMDIITLSLYELEKFTAILYLASQNFPKEVSFAYRHAITSQDNFEMKAGFSNFDSVVQGQHLANDVKGEILCPTNGYILMPLYQKQGNDGFFIVN